MVAGGKVNASEAEVVKLVPGKTIELVSYSGLIAYRATFTLMPKGAHATEVTCVLNFEFKNFVLNLARPVIEGMAEARIRGDLETLRVLISENKPA
jgi:ribosome-associated toxin RatA of RatAB toxin-antitoxin module